MNIEQTRRVFMEQVICVEDLKREFVSKKGLLRREKKIVPNTYEIIKHFNSLKQQLNN